MKQKEQELIDATKEFAESMSYKFDSRTESFVLNAIRGTAHDIKALVSAEIALWNTSKAQAQKSNDDVSRMLCESKVNCLIELLQKIEKLH